MVRLGRPRKDRPSLHLAIRFPTLRLWRPVFANGLRHTESLESHLFGFGVNVGVSGLQFAEVRAGTRLNCEFIAFDLRHSADLTTGLVAKVKELLDLVPAEHRREVSLAVDCGTYRGAIRCRFNVEFGSYAPSRAVTTFVRQHLRDTDFLRIRDAGEVVIPFDRTIWPITSDIAALVVIAFEERLATLRDSFAVTVGMRPDLVMADDPALPGTRFNAGLCYIRQDMRERLAEETRGAALRDDAEGLLGRFAEQYPTGSPEAFLAVVASAPKALRGTVVEMLAKAGYPSAPAAVPGWHPRGPVYVNGPIAFEARNLTALVRELSASLDLVCPGWRDVRTAA